MPKILQKRKVGKRGSVVQYGSGSSAGKFFYRELVPGTERYLTRCIQGAETLDDACAEALDVAAELAADRAKASTVFSAVTQSGARRSTNVIPSSARKRRAVPLTAAVHNWLTTEKERADKGLCSEGTYDNKRICLQQHMLPYLMEEKQCINTNQVVANTFDRYELYRSSTTPLMRQREVSIIKEFFTKYLVRERYVDSAMANDSSFLPRITVKETDRMKNPAIDPDDWRLIMDYVRNHWIYYRRPDGKYMVEPHNQRQDGRYFRHLIWHYMLFLHGTGMSPEEVQKLKWRQIEVIDVGRTNSKGEREEWLETNIRTIRSKTQQAREIPCNQGRELKRWLNYQKEFINQQRLTYVFTPDSLVFGKMLGGNIRYDAKHYYAAVREIYDLLKPQLKGHRFSPHPYTQYSMRSSFIENHLRRGTDIFLLARIAGHDVKELMKSYERLDIRERASEITIDTTKFGTKKQTNEVINLLDP